MRSQVWVFSSNTEYPCSSKRTLHLILVQRYVTPFSFPLPRSTGIKYPSWHLPHFGYIPSPWLLVIVVTFNPECNYSNISFYALLCFFAFFLFCTFFLGCFGSFFYTGFCNLFFSAGFLFC